MAAKVVKLREVDGVVYASTRDVANDFRRNHFDVLNAVKDVKAKITGNIQRSWFRDDFYLDSYNRRQPCTDMTRDGWTLVVMGFTGQEAMDWKVAYILKFNDMEGKLGAGARTDALFGRSKRDNVVDFQGPSRAQAELPLTNPVPCETLDVEHEGEIYQVTLERVRPYRIQIRPPTTIDPAIGKMLDDESVMLSLAMQLGITHDQLCHAFLQNADSSPSSILGAVLDRIYDLKPLE